MADGQQDDEQLRSLFAEIKKAIGRKDLSAVVTHADQVLSLIPDDADALRCKVTALIQQGKHNDALKATDGKRFLAYEHAYCLFRLKRYDEALKACDRSPSPSDSEEQGGVDPNLFQELKAQVLYRLERFKDAVAIYDRLLKDASDDLTTERETNAAAARAAGCAVDPAAFKRAKVARQDSYELSYNAACLSMAQGKYKHALKQLKTAQEQCREALQEEELPEEDIEAELNLLLVQEGIVHLLLGHGDKAAELLQGVIKSKPDDAALVAVASNAIVALHKDRDVFDSRKKMKATQVEGLEAKLSSAQRRAFAHNQALLLALANQGSACRQACADLAKAYPDSDAPAIITALSYQREKKLSQAVDTLTDAETARKGEARPTSNLALLRAHLLLLSGRKEQALDALSALDASLKHTPALVGLRIALLNSLERGAETDKAMNEALEYWKEHQMDSASTHHYTQLTLAAGDLRLSHGDFKGASETFSHVVEEDAEDASALAKLVLALSKFDLAGAEKHSERLPDVELAGSANVNVDDLEANPLLKVFTKRRKGQRTTAAAQVAKAAKQATEDTSASDTTASAAAVASKDTGASDGAPPKSQRKKRRKRPGKRPQNYNPDVAPDPDRWLPRWQRKTFVGRRRRKHKESVGKGTQGASSAEMDALDASKRPTQQQAAPTSARPPTKSKRGGKKGKRK